MLGDEMMIEAYSGNHSFHDNTCHNLIIESFKSQLIFD